jgi:hypothetical protein
MENTMTLNVRTEVRLSENEKAQWGAAAASSGLSVSEWVRGLANEYLAAQAQAKMPAQVAPGAVVCNASVSTTALAPNTAPLGRPHYDRLCPVCAREGVPSCPLCKFLNRVEN